MFLLLIDSSPNDVLGRERDPFGWALLFLLLLLLPFPLVIIDVFILRPDSQLGRGRVITFANKSLDLIERHFEKQSTIEINRNVVGSKVIRSKFR